VHFFNLDHLRNYTSKFRPYLRHKFRAPSLPLPPLTFSYLQALIHGFLWWWAYSQIIFSFKWHLQSPFLLLHSTIIDLQEANDFINEEDPRPTSSTWSYIMHYWPYCRPWIFFINWVLCFLKINGSRIEKDERWLEMSLQG